MTNCAIYLPIQPELYWHFQQVSTRINTLNKTLDGVIYMSTQMGYQRLEKVSSALTAVQAIPYLDHFFTFVQQGHHNQLVIK